jgi:light-regulated signal transduction histidine kinase (bacteriophytochrome)
MSVDWAELIPHIAHDTRALVRKCLSHAQLVEKSLAGTGDADISESLRAIIESQIDLNYLCVRLVALSDAERPHPSNRRPETVDLETAVLSAKLECAAAIRKAGAELVITQLPEAVVPQKTQIVLKELMDNSLRYREPSRALRVVIHAETCGDKVRVRVADNGTGVAPAYMDKLFQPLERLDAVRSGFGLGLVIAQAIVASAGGRIEVEPSDEGASFVFELPIRI